MDDRIASLPDVLVALDGEKTTTAQQWMEKRRPEILSLFRDQVYGSTPIGRPESLRFEQTANKSVFSGTAQCKQVDITFEGPGGKGKIPLWLFLPNDVPGPVPAFLLITNRNLDLENYGNETSPFFPADDIISRGYAAAVFKTRDVDPDVHDDFQNGVHGIFDPPETPRPKNAWGTIAAWAWGAGRVMDYLETNPDIDAGRVAVVGHSRGGKTSLWAGAVDQRFAMVVSNNSGSTGAAISRGKKGESVRAINTTFPHWFTENYKTFNDREDEMPFDQHMLLALIAPRLLYVTSATEDEWSDPESEFLAAALTDPVYRLFDLDGLGEQCFPKPEEPIFGDHVGYHLRTGKHGLWQYDWQRFMDFADSFL